MQDKQYKRLTARQLEKKLEEQAYKCRLTGVEMTPALASLDHIDPRSLGGNDDIKNIQIVLAGVNKAKGTMTQSQFISMCLSVARTWADPHDDTWVEHRGHAIGG